MASIAHFPFPIPLRATFVKRRRAIPTFGSRQAPRHEPGYARHEYTRILALRKQLSYHPMFRRGIRLRRRRQVGRRAKQGALRSKVARARATQPPASLAVHPTATRPFPQRPQRLDSLARSRLWTGEDHARQRAMRHKRDAATSDGRTGGAGRTPPARVKRGKARAWQGRAAAWRKPRRRATKPGDADRR